MTLKTKLIVATTLFVLLLFGVSEWLNYQATSAFVDQCKAMLRARVDHPILLARLEEAESRMLTQVTRLRIVYASLTVVAAVAVLNLLLYRLVVRPIRQILSHINAMGRGNWNNPIPVERKDEIGQLALAFNELGQTLTSTVNQFATASKLSALALLGSRMLRKINLATDHVNGVVILLKVAKQRNQSVPEPAINNLQFTARSMRDLEKEFEIEFQREFLRCAETVPNSSRLRNGTAVPLEQAAAGKAAALHGANIEIMPSVTPP